MALLRDLRVVQRHALVLEISARILPVGVEEERIEPAVEVVVMMNILARASARIELCGAAAEIARGSNGERGKRRRGRVLRFDEIEKIGERALGDAEALVHIGFAEPEIGIGQNPQQRGRAVEGDGNWFAGSVADRERAFGAEQYLQRSPPHALSHYAFKPPLHDRTRPQPPSKSSLPGNLRFGASPNHSKAM